MTKTQKLVPNYKLQDLLAQRVPFTNYNKTIVAEIDENNIYKVRHHEADLFHYDLTKNEIVNWDFRYYSQTTSTLQGRIIRALVSRSNLEMLLRHYKSTNDQRTFRRIRGMARIG